MSKSAVVPLTVKVVFPEGGGEGVGVGVGAGVGAGVGVGAGIAVGLGVGVRAWSPMYLPHLEIIIAAQRHK